MSVHQLMGAKILFQGSGHRPSKNELGNEEAPATIVPLGPVGKKLL